jgi:hypothetical protein
MYIIDDGGNIESVIQVTSIDIITHWDEYNRVTGRSSDGHYIQHAYKVQDIDKQDIEDYKEIK